jgi:hypothetical protein
MPMSICLSMLSDSSTALSNYLLRDVEREEREDKTGTVSATLRQFIRNLAAVGIRNLAAVTAQSV